MSPKLQAVKEALERMDRAPPYGCGHDDARKELLKAAHAAGFSSARACEDWARYVVAVGEVRDEGADDLEPEPEQESLF